MYMQVFCSKMLHYLYSITVSTANQLSVDTTYNVLLQLSKIIAIPYTSIRNELLSGLHYEKMVPPIFEKVKAKVKCQDGNNDYSIMVSKLIFVCVWMTSTFLTPI